MPKNPTYRVYSRLMPVVNFLWAILFFGVLAGCGSPDNVPLVEQPLTIRQAAPENIKTLSSGSRVVISDLLVVVHNGVTREKAEQMFSRLGLDIVGYVPEAYLYQVAISAPYTEAKLNSARETLEAETLVDSVSYNAVFQGSAAAAVTSPVSGAVAATTSVTTTPKDPNYSDQLWALNNINAPAAWNFFERVNNKSSVKVGVIDSGFNGDHPDISFAALYGPQGQTDAASARLPAPTVPPMPASEVDWSAYAGNWKNFNHGMHVAGIIAANSNTMTTVGLAWPANVELHAARYDGSHATILAHIARLARSGVKVINSSLGYDDVAAPTVALISDRRTNAAVYGKVLKHLLISHDFLTIWGAGNEKKSAMRQAILGFLFQPEFDQFAGVDLSSVRFRTLIVGATQAVLDGEVPGGNVTGASEWADEYSNYGSGIVQIVAPGGDISTNLPNDKQDPNQPLYFPLSSVSWAGHGRSVTSLGMNPGQAIEMSGTSMAAPHVTGAAALVWAVNSRLSAAQVKEILISSATQNITGPDGSYPMLDVRSALSMAVQTSGQTVSAPSGDALLLLTTECRVGPVNGGVSSPFPNMPVRIRKYVGEEWTSFVGNPWIEVATGATSDAGIFDVSLPINQQYEVILGAGDGIRFFTDLTQSPPVSLRE